MTDTASTANEDEKPSFATENDLDFEMTEEREQEFINETLGLNQPVKSEEKEEEDAKDAGTDDKSDDDDKDDTDPADDTKDEAGKEEEDAEVKPTVKEEEPSDPELPLEVQTDDLWIEVDKVTLDDDGNEKTEKVKLVYDPKDPSTFIPDDFRFKSDKQLADILEAKAEMATLYKERNAEVESKTQEQTQAEQAQQAKDDQLASWDEEIADLIENKIIPEPKVKPGEKGFLEDESIKQIDAVFKYMTVTNEERTKDGKPLIKSFGTAFTMYQNDAKVKAEAEAKKADQAEAKKKASLVGGSSAGGTEPAKGYKPGSYSSIYDIPIDV